MNWQPTNQASDAHTKVYQLDCLLKILRFVPETLWVADQKSKQSSHCLMSNFLVLAHEGKMNMQSENGTSSEVERESWEVFLYHHWGLVNFETLNCLGKLQRIPLH
jgi:hypothetical protein